MAARVWTLFDTLDLGTAADNVTGGQGADTIDFMTFDAINGDDYYFNTRRNVWHYDMVSNVVTNISGNNFDGGATPAIADIMGLVWFNNNLYATVINTALNEGYVMEWDGTGTTTWTEKNDFTTIKGAACTPNQDKRRPRLGTTASVIALDFDGTLYTSNDASSFSSSATGIIPFGISMRTNITASIETDWNVNDGSGTFDFMWGYFKGELFGGHNVGGGASRMYKTNDSGTTKQTLADNPDYSATATLDRSVNFSIIGTGDDAILFPAFKFNTSGGYDSNLAWVFDGTDFIQDGDMDGSTTTPTSSNRPHSYFVYGTKVICRTDANISGYGYHLFQADSGLPAVDPVETFVLTHSTGGIPGSIY